MSSISPILPSNLSPTFEAPSYPNILILLVMVTLRMFTLWFTPLTCFLIHESLIFIRSQVLFTSSSTMIRVLQFSSLPTENRYKYPQMPKKVCSHTKWSVKFRRYSTGHIISKGHFITINLIILY